MTTTLVALPLAAASGAVSWKMHWAVFGAGVLVALVGFLDDHRHVPAPWRLLVHFIAGIWALAWLGGLPPVDFLGRTVSLGWIGAGLALVYLVWLLNLYNFMDGIDGIASIETICVCAGGALLYLLDGVPEMAAAPLLLAVSVAGFLPWNFPPARIFMGDVGSGFLGIALGVMSIQAAWVSTDLFFGWLILLGVFVVDATVTLVRRLLRGEKVYEAHRLHAYQQAANRHGHLRVTLAAAVITLLWLLPNATLVTAGKLQGGVGIMIAYLPMIVLARRLRAGVREPPQL